MACSGTLATKVPRVAQVVVDSVFTRKPSHKHRHKLLKRQATARLKTAGRQRKVPQTNTKSLHLKNIFILGDSRTGTLSISNYLNAVGRPSIHYYEKEAKQLPHIENNREENFRNIVEFIRRSGATAFSDYPTRLYFKELADSYPDAYFVLTTRRDLATWKKSMVTFFGKFLINLDIDELAKIYIQLNDEIRSFFTQKPELNFLEICIDDGSQKNTALLKYFLGIESNIEIGYDNKTADISNEIPSGRYRLIGASGIPKIEAIETFRPDSKGLLSEYGWIFLMNDSNQFLHHLYGSKSWTELQKTKAFETLAIRQNKLIQYGAKYFKFIIPEKPVVYPEFLPKALQSLTANAQRPALQICIEFPEFISYLAEYLKDAKSYGPLYFRGDSHPNWLGSYLIYQYAINHIRPKVGSSLPPPIPAGKLIPTVYGYDGDVFSQISDEDRSRLNDQWSDLQFSGAFEYCVKYELSMEDRRSKTVPISDALATMSFSRELLVKEIEDPALPTAVIFRDSTTAFMLDLLAEHFSRVVFVWHRGEVVRQVIEEENPDVVIHFMAERFVTAYGEDMVSLSDFYPD